MLEMVVYLTAWLMPKQYQMTGSDPATGRFCVQ